MTYPFLPDDARSDPALPPRMVLNRRVYETAIAMNRAGLDMPGLPPIRHWNHHVPPLALHLVAPALAAQGSDIAQALLIFAAAKPVRADDGTSGWIAVQLARCLGQDGLPEGERIAWVGDRRDLWQRIAEDPLANREWTEAPRPWSALAAAIEWDAFLCHDCIEFPSRLPVTLTAAQLGGESLHGVTAMSDTAVFCSAAAAAAFGLSFMPFGPGLYATHAADAWLLDVTVADAFKLLGRFAQSEGGPSTAAATLM